jgi:hypothetical protein
MKGYDYELGLRKKELVMNEPKSAPQPIEPKPEPKPEPVSEPKKPEPKPQKPKKSFGSVFKSWMDKLEDDE